MKTLKLFNAVIAKKSNEQAHLSDLGFIIEPQALWAKDLILKYYESQVLDGNDLNKTFHKSWEKIKNSSRYELLVDQLKHYISTYGSNFEDDIYIPNEVLDLPDVKLSYKVIKAYTIDELTGKCLSILNSGIALTSDTLNDLLHVLTEELDYKFTGNENIKNKEAIILIADSLGIFPKNPSEFFRYIIYKSTNDTLLIKSKEVIDMIKTSDFNPDDAFNKFGLVKLAEIFNRFKPLFLAYKPKCSVTINKISKLSKKHHKPLVQNPLNSVTSTLLTTDDEGWLDKATPFALFKAMSACYARMNGQDSFVYRIRNGKLWLKESEVKDVNVFNYNYLIKYLKQRFNMEGIKMYFPEGIDYALPVSEKMFIENIPTGTKFYGDKLAVGIYWKDSWGAKDLDLSGINIGGKIGWDSEYSQDGGKLLFSGDITSAPKGAVEYLYAVKGLKEPTLVFNNVYYGEKDCNYKIVIGKGDDISRNYMMNPENLICDIKTNSVQKNTILGMLIPEKEGQSFVLLNFGAGNTRVSGNNEISDLANKALFQQWEQSISFKQIVVELGATISETPEEVDADFSIEALEKDSFIKVFDEL